jgi:hypothetical protein
MGQPKKLSYQQRMDKKEDAKLALIHRDLIRLHLAVNQKVTKDSETWRWAALDIYTVLRKEFNTSHKVEKYKEAALKIARDAQTIIHLPF